MTAPGTPGALPVGRHALGSYPHYEQAQAVVDHLSDRGFPVETVTIVGADLRLVEQVTGRLTTGRAASAGAASMAWFGLLLGLFVGFFAESATAPLGLAVWGLLSGALFGAVLGFVAHRATGGRRDFSSTRTLAATRYELLVEQSRADEAERLLAEYRST
jgi:hypothetical protein